MPAFSATEVFNYLRASYPDYTYKEATLNPRPTCATGAVDWEADLWRTSAAMGMPRNFPGNARFRRAVDVFGPADCGGGPCLGCHSTPAAAPAAMIEFMERIMDSTGSWEYGGSADCFGTDVGPLNIADRAFRTLMIYMCGLGLAALILLDLAMVWIVIRPVSRLSALADEVSNGNFNVPEIPVKGSDEISDLARLVQSHVCEHGEGNADAGIVREEFTHRSGINLILNERNRQWLLKNSLTGKWSKNFAIGSSTNDDLYFGRHFLSPKIWLFCENRSFSTATPGFVNYCRSHTIQSAI